MTRHLDQLWQAHQMKLKKLQEKMGYIFADENLLKEALTHSSAARDYNRHHEIEHTVEQVVWNERLEFLGDAVLGLAISTNLMKRDTRYAEGQLSKIRSSLVRESTLALVARQIDLGSCMLCGRGELKTGGPDKESLLADCLEAVIGAVYTDGGFDQVCSVLEGVFADMLNADFDTQMGKDFKTLLQEVTQDRFKILPEYKVLAKTGPAHQPLFEMSVSLGKENLGIGKAPSKKKASQIAAKEALESLEGTNT